MECNAVKTDSGIISDEVWMSIQHTAALTFRQKLTINAGSNI